MKKLKNKIISVLCVALVSSASCVDLPVKNILDIKASAIKGDMNSDSKINAVDLVMMINHLLLVKPEVEFDFSAADINDDGVVNIIDAVMLKQKILYDTIEEVYVSAEYDMVEQNVKYFGRAHYYNEVLWLAPSASGVEFEFTGFECSLTLLGDNIINSENSRARVGVFVNGELVLDTMIDKPEQTFKVFESTEAKSAVVKVVKFSESANSTFGIKSANVNGTKIKPTSNKELNIEFIGDSITCGYGVDTTRENPFTTSKENASKTYAYITAQDLNADYSFVSYSGYGVVSGYTSNGVKNSTSLVMPYYNKIGNSYGAFNSTLKPNTIEWDFNKKVSDIIVINLGTNDSTYCKDAEKRLEFEDGYIEMLKKIREYNGTSKIVCTLGIMGADLYPNVENAVNRYKTSTADENVFTMQFEVQQYNDGYGGDWHPSEITHKKAAEKLTDFLKTIIN